MVWSLPDEREKQRNILGNQFRQVHIAQSAHQQHFFWIIQPEKVLKFHTQHNSFMKKEICC
jgi:hypothetical protein